ncbi:MAG: acetyl-CoA C-acetyltransferase [Acidimicrobiia bacterium]|nr:acetyl-CoA C-acetyltransferase [Acidimicrobiia bacterium]
MPEAVIVATARTPIARAFKGSLVDERADDMAAFIVDAVLNKVPELDRHSIEDLVLGCGLPGGEQGFNMGRVVAILAGMPTVPGTTITRYCSSSLQSLRMVAHAVKAGEGDAFIAAGVEAVSRFMVGGSSDHTPNTQNPRFADAAIRSAERMAGGQGTWTPPEGMPDVYIAMGETAENVAALEGVSREAMDEFAVRSQNRAGAAIERGFFEREITPYTLSNGTVVTSDDCPRPGTELAKLASLSPVFRPDGLVTAGNACPLNDGASAVIVMSDTRAAELGITPLARIVSSGVTGLDPEIMGLGPIEASRQALARAGMTIDDVDLVEINEAFAAQVLPSAEALGIDLDKLNVNGGAIALGHPFGMTGARIMTTLLNGLEDADKTIGLETMCVGGGQGMAMIVERLS